MGLRCAAIACLLLAVLAAASGQSGVQSTHTAQQLQIYMSFILLFINGSTSMRLAELLFPCCAARCMCDAIHSHSALCRQADALDLG